MSVRIVPLVAVNALATFAKQQRIRGVERYSAEGVAWALFQANLASFRSEYGDRSAEIAHDIIQIEKTFRYEAVDLDANTLLRHLLDVMYNSVTHEGCFQSDAWRICQRLSVWILLRADLERANFKGSQIDCLDTRTERYLRYGAAKLYGAPKTPGHHFVKNQPDLFKPARTDQAESSPPATANHVRPEALN